MVWLATWPRDSRVISPWAPTRWATRWEMRIMNRRISRVKRASGQWSRSCSWIRVKGTTWTVSRPHQGVRSFARVRTFSLASGEV